jgi:hypothetical protein
VVGSGTTAATDYLQLDSDRARPGRYCVFRRVYWLPAIGFESYARTYAQRRPVPEGTQRGGLMDLLRAGEQGVRVLEEHVALPVPELQARVRANNGSVVLEVHGARAVRRLFALRPSHVTFYAYLPEEPPRIAHVAVTYVDR